MLLFSYKPGKPLNCDSYLISSQKETNYIILLTDCETKRLLQELHKLADGILLMRNTEYINNFLRSSQGQE